MFSFDNFLMDHMPVKSRCTFDRLSDPMLAYWPEELLTLRRQPCDRRNESRNLYSKWVNGLIDEILDPRCEQNDVEMEIEHEPKAQSEIKDQPIRLEEQTVAKQSECSNCNNNVTSTEKTSTDLATTNNDLQLSKPTQINLRLTQYKPEDITVHVKDNKLTIKGRKERKGNNSYYSQQFERSFTLPKDCDQQNIICEMDKNGLIKLNIPHKQLVKPDEIKEIKINCEEKAKKDEPEASKPESDEPIVEDIIEG